MSRADLPVVWLLGPTAVGKSQVALQLAARIPVELVSVDSAQVYRGLDVGSAKPSPAERAHVPHHLIDIRDPAEPYSAANFVADAERAIADIHQRERIPLLVGGTMLYFKALREGLAKLPAANPQVRARLTAEAETQGWDTLHRALAELDPETAARTPPGNRQRVLRALEVHALTGTPLSVHHKRQAAAPTRPWKVHQFGLLPPDRTWLHLAIERRLNAMLDAGLLAEVAALRRRPDLHLGLPALRSVGYRQAWEHLDGALEFDAMKSKALAATRQLAKRQLTWMRTWPDLQTLPCTAPAASALQIHAQLPI